MNFSMHIKIVQLNIKSDGRHIEFDSINENENQFQLTTLSGFPS